MDVLGFKQFKNFHGDVLAKRAQEGLGILSKADFLVAIAEPFRLTFTPERIKKSFKLVGLHPYNLDAITPAMMATSRVTSSHAPIHINVSSPIKRLNDALSAVRFEIFATPPDSSLLPPPIPNDPANPADPANHAAELDLTSLPHDELCAYVKSLIGHSTDLVNVIKAQRIQIGLDDMAINQFQQQVYQKEQHGKMQCSLTTMPTIATE